MISRLMLLLRPTRPPHASHGKYSATVPPKTMEAPRADALGLIELAALPEMTGTLPRATSATVPAMRRKAAFISLGSSASTRLKALDSSRMPRTSTLTLSATAGLRCLQSEFLLGVTPHAVRPPFEVLPVRDRRSHRLDGHAQSLREGEVERVQLFLDEGPLSLCLIGVGRRERVCRPHPSLSWRGPRGRGCR